MYDLRNGKRRMKVGVKRLLVCAVALFCTVPRVLAEQEKMRDSGSWSGVIINSSCTPEQAFAEAAECTQKMAGGRLSLYDDTTREIFDLDPQEPAAVHLGDIVTVHGTVDGKTLRVSKIELLTSIGLAVGEKAPAFSARDQFGHEQSLDSLKGPNGTVLLFFRSADW
jgi:hypothetical protein